MSSSLNTRIITKAAAADVSTKQYYCAVIDSNGRWALQTTAGGPVAGAFQEVAAATALGKPAGVAVGDIVQYIAGGVINPGGPVACNAAGKVVAATLATVSGGAGDPANDPVDGSNIVGYYSGDTAAADGDIIEVMRYQSTGAAPTTPV